MTSIIVLRVTTQPRLSLPFVVYNSACVLPQSGARGRRGVRAVGVATSNSFLRKKAKNKSKKQAVQMLRTGNIYAYTNLREDWSGITNARRDFCPIVKTHLHTSPLVVKIYDISLSLFLSVPSRVDTSGACPTREGRCT